MGYMMDGQQMMHRPPGDPAFHNQYAHYPAEYYGHHLWGELHTSLPADGDAFSLVIFKINIVFVGVH